MTVSKESIPDFRETNQLKRVTLGRANDDTNFNVNLEFAFEDLAVTNGFLIPCNYRKTFGLLGTDHLF